MPLNRSSAMMTVRARLAFSEGDEDELAFLQRRVANAGLFGVCFAGGFIVLRIVLSLVASDWENFREGSFWLHVAAAVPLLGLWLYCRRGQRSERALVTAETACVTLAGVFIVAMGAYMPAVFRPDYVVVIAMAAVLTARSIYVPSTAIRTTFMAAALTLPYLAMAHQVLGRLPPALRAEMLAELAAGSETTLGVVFVVFAAAWWTAAMTVSVAASRVIYGLREQVTKVQRLGQYQLEEQLGEGGMGVVYRAHHALLQRPTAVKLLKPEKVGEQSLERFEREVRQTARLSHPNTITIFDYGHTPDGVFYYAMELLDGVTLDHVVAASGPLPAPRVLHLLRQAAGSLAEAHALGLVHRDIKPENIMLCEQGGVPDTVKVLDFGLVKEVARADDLKLTGTNVIMGTPRYMAPEALVSPDELDARADLYALAGTAYFLLTGRDVFESESLVELCSDHLRTPPTPPSQLLEGVPSDLEALLLRCLEKNPDDRPQHAGELVDLLGRCHDANRWTVAEARSWWSRHGAELARPGGVSPTAPTLLAGSLEAG